MVSLLCSFHGASLLPSGSPSWLVPTSGDTEAWKLLDCIIWTSHVCNSWSQIPARCVYALTEHLTLLTPKWSVAETFCCVKSAPVCFSRTCVRRFNILTYTLKIFSWLHVSFYHTSTVAHLCLPHKCFSFFLFVCFCWSQAQQCPFSKLSSTS